MGNALIKLEVLLKEFNQPPTNTNLMGQKFRVNDQGQTEYLTFRWTKTLSNGQVIRCRRPYPLWLPTDNM